MKDKLCELGFHKNGPCCGRDLYSSCYASIWTQVDGKNIGFVLGPHPYPKAVELAESMDRIGFAVVSSFSQALDMASDWQNKECYRRAYHAQN